MEEWKYTKEQLQTWRTSRLGILFINTYLRLAEVYSSDFGPYVVIYKEKETDLRNGTIVLIDILAKRKLKEKAEVLEQMAQRACTLEEELKQNEKKALTPAYEELLKLEKMIYEYTTEIIGRRHQ